MPTTLAGGAPLDICLCPGLGQVYCVFAVVCLVISSDRHAEVAIMQLLTAYLQAFGHTGQNLLFLPRTNAWKRDATKPTEALLPCILFKQWKGGLD